MRVTCKACGQVWNSNADYANRDVCNNMECPQEMGRGKPKHIRVPSEKVIKTTVETNPVGDKYKDYKGSRYYLEVPEVIYTKIHFR